METSLIAPDTEGWVNARNLHHELGVKSHFAEWIKRRLKSHGAQKGIDFLTHRVVEKRKNGQRGAAIKEEFEVSAFMAEHFAMMEDTPVGRNIRAYYIQARKATEAMALVIARQRDQIAALTAPKAKRLGNGRQLRTLIEIVETRDMFGNKEIKKNITKEYFNEMGPIEQRLARTQQLTRIGEGIAKRLKVEMCGDDLKH